jgi:sec-independent protein translocase protein TatC
VRFLQNFNSDAFNVLVQASDYYKFEVLALLGLGLLFQIPVGVLAATRLGIVTTQQLRRNRRYALLAIAVVAMLLPGTDPVTMLIAMVPLLVLYELSILLAGWLGKPIGGPEADDGDLDDDQLLS